MSSSHGAINSSSGKKLNAVAEKLPLVAKIKGVVSPSSTDDNVASSKKRGHTLIHYIVYAIINVIIALPALYGFSSFIFNHSIFQPHVAACQSLLSLAHSCINWALFYSRVWNLLLVLYR